MRKLLALTLLLSLGMAQTGLARTVEVYVHGMTCAFCVDSLERKFGKMESVSKIQVSLKMKKIRLETDENFPNVDTIKQMVIDAGFTPIKIEVLSDKKVQK